jgi:WD40 repeat protein
VAVVGTGRMERDEILVLRLVKNDKGKFEFVQEAKSVTENILTLKFSPVESDKLVSCGKENIRFMRIKNQCIKGSPVVLNHHARNTIFTVLDFDFGFDGQPNLSIRNDKVKRVFVGSKHGYLYQVNYDSRVLEAVFKIHDYSICSIAISSGFCVTGSQDQYLRVWPLDFSEFYLEAYHEGFIISLDISYDS